MSALFSIIKNPTAYLRGGSSVVITAGSLILISALAMGAYAWRRSPAVLAQLTPIPARAPEAIAARAAPRPGTEAAGNQMGDLIIKLRRTGFEPANVSRPRGRVLLAFDNLTGADEITLQLKQETGNKLHEVRMPRGTVRWRKALDVPAGRYILSVAEHPEWVCHITITAN